MFIDKKKPTNLTNKLCKLLCKENKPTIIIIYKENKKN